jgi:hypothetical protein
MKNFDLSSMGVQEMNTMEMKETDGGLICLLIAAAVVLIGASSCVNGPFIVMVGGTNNTVNPTGGGTVNADSSRIEIPINVPIGY